MRTIVVRAKAVADPENIWRFTAREWSVAQADEYTGTLRDAIEQIHLGFDGSTTFEHARPGFRRLLVGSHAVFYRETSRRIDFVRILHQRQSAPRHLK